MIQAAGTLSLFRLGAEDNLALLIGTGVARIGHMVAVVGYTIAATSGLPDEEQGLASGLVTTAQLVGLTVGTPVLSSIATGGLRSLTPPSGCKARYPVSTTAC